MCFVFLGALTAAGSFNGPDQVWKDDFGYEKFMVLKGTSGGSYGGSRYCEEPIVYPIVPS